jgi:hypothetical protein
VPCVTGEVDLRVGNLDGPHLRRDVSGSRHRRAC